MCHGIAPSSIFLKLNFFMNNFTLLKNYTHQISKGVNLRLCACRIVQCGNSMVFFKLDFLWIILLWLKISIHQISKGVNLRLCACGIARYDISVAWRCTFFGILLTIFLDISFKEYKLNINIYLMWLWSIWDYVPVASNNVEWHCQCSMPLHLL